MSEFAAAESTPEEQSCPPRFARCQTLGRTVQFRYEALPYCIAPPKHAKTFNKRQNARLFGTRRLIVRFKRNRGRAVQPQSRPLEIPTKRRPLNLTGFGAGIRGNISARMRRRSNRGIAQPGRLCQRKPSSAWGPCREAV